MGILINPGDSDFIQELSDELYVDKTGLIELTNESFASNRRKYICVSRPRRFGKTTAANMLTAYYQIDCKQNEVFSNLEIKRHPSFSAHAGKYNVIRMDIARIGADFSDIESTIAQIKKLIYSDIVAEFSSLEEYNNKILPYLDEKTVSPGLTALYNVTGILDVIVIDEWDYLFRRYPEDKVGLTAFINFLSGILKGASYAGLVFMTGILPVKTYGDDSILNMFRPITITNPLEYGVYTGFTRNEVEKILEQSDVPMSEVDEWYDGYNVPAIVGDKKTVISIYNPNSVMQAKSIGQIQSYWTNTQSFEKLKDYINLDLMGLKGNILGLLAGMKIQVNMRSFPFRINELRNTEDVLTLLVHLGYLTFEPGRDVDNGYVSIPNKEVRNEFEDAIKEDELLEPLTKRLGYSNDLLEATLRKDVKAVEEAIARSHEENASVLKANDENSLAAVITMAYYTAITKYEIFRELPSGKGFADLAFVPRKGQDCTPMIIELKWDKDADTAINQIKANNYAGKLARGFGKVLLVGINYKKGNRGKYEVTFDVINFIGDN